MRTLLLVAALLPLVTASAAAQQAPSCEDDKRTLNVLAEHDRDASRYAALTSAQRVAALLKRVAELEAELAKAREKK